jgi:hypothetical protein
MTAHIVNRVASAGVGVGEGGLAINEFIESKLDVVR